MTDKGGRKFEPLPARRAERDAPERLPTSAMLDAITDAPPERMPSAAFVPDPAQRSATPGSAMERRPPRTAYVPPRLGQPPPRALRHTRPISGQVAQWLNSVVRTLRGMHMYADNNARRREYFDQTVQQLERILSEVGEMELDVREDRILVGPDVVHFSPDPIEGLSSMLFTNGIRRLRIIRGVSRIEVLRLLAAFATDFSRPESANEDLVTILSRLALGHVRATGAEPMTPPKRPEPAQRPTRTPPPVVYAEPEPPPVLDAPAALPMLSESAIHPVHEEPADPVTEQAVIAATRALAAAGVDPFGDDDEVTVPARPPAPPRAPTPAVRAFEDDEATVLCDSATGRAIAALIAEEMTLDTRENAETRGTVRDPAETPNDFDDEFATATLDDNAVGPDIAADLLLPSEPKTPKR